MSETIPPDDPDRLLPDEQRLATLLILLRGDELRHDPQFVPSLLRIVRWQRGVRELAQLLGSLASAIGSGLAIGLGRRSLP